MKKKINLKQASLSKKISNNDFPGFVSYLITMIFTDCLLVRMVLRNKMFVAYIIVFSHSL